MDLSRFLDAQQGVYDTACAELRAGRKETHWMWFIFPQLAGLGRSDMARRFAIADLDEARAYLAHPVLGLRLLECARLAFEAKTDSATELMGSPDDLKLRSSATLFALVSNDRSVFHRLLDKYFRGQQDRETLMLLKGSAEPPTLESP